MPNCYIDLFVAIKKLREYCESLAGCENCDIGDDIGCTDGAYCKIPQEWDIEP